MAATPDDLAEPPIYTMDGGFDPIDLVRFSGSLFLEAAFSPDWCVRSHIGPGDCGPGIHARGGLMAFHFILEGSIEVRLPDEPPRRVEAGDMLLLPRNDLHFLGSNTHLTPRDAGSLIRRASNEAMAKIQFGTEPHPHRFVCGFISLAQPNHPLLDGLPGLIVVRLGDRPGASWARSTFLYAAHEHALQRPDAQGMLAKMAELLFAEAIRDYAENIDAADRGWLSALKDPALARALTACHRQPEHPWTTEQLAKTAFLSRSAFAERFALRLGCPPMTYLTRWRMQLAGRRLRESNDTIAQIAAEVGYESESTFSRAFVREVGYPPGEWRRQSGQT
jgi:AraC-like DNA-binding protein